MSGRGVATLIVAGLVGTGAVVGAALSRPAASPPALLPAAGPAPDTHVARGRRIRVEVLNASGVEGAARAATDLLRDRGFDVVYFGNAAHFGRDRSLVLDRSGAAVLARTVADVLGIGNVRSEPDADLYLDVSVVLGTDWALPREPRDTLPAPRPPWWDPRRWWGSEGRVTRPARRGVTTHGSNR